MTGMMVFAGGLLVLVGFALLGATFITGIILFVVGLARKRPSLWVTGLILGVLAMVILPCGGALAFYGLARSTAVSARRAAVAVSAPVPAAPPSRQFAACPGLNLPPGTMAVRSRTITLSRRVAQTCHYLVLRVPPDFGDFLEANFTPAAWQDVQAELTAEDALSAGLWQDGDVRDRMYYTRSHRSDPDSPDRMFTAVAYDPDAGRAYVAGVQKWDDRGVERE